MKVSDARFADLASFVLTGQPAALAFASSGQPTSAQPATSAQPTSAGNDALAPVSATPSEPAPAAELTARSSASFGLPRILALSGIGIGLIVAGTGLGVFLSGAKDRGDLGDALTPDGSVKPGYDAAEVAFVDSKVKANKTASLALGLTGLGVAAVAAVLFFVLPQSSEAQVSAIVTPNGAYAGVTGSF
jgi:hypothetical protein